MWGQDHNYAQAAGSQGRLCGNRGVVAVVCPDVVTDNVGGLSATLPPEGLSYPTIPGPPRLPGMASMSDDDSIMNLIRVIDEIREGRHPVTDFELQIFYAIERNRQRDQREELVQNSLSTRFERLGDRSLE